MVADVADGYMSLHGGEAVNLRWTHLLWLGGLLLFAVAADGQWAHATEEEAAEKPVRPRRAFSVLPYLAVAGGYGLLLVVARGLALYEAKRRGRGQAAVWSAATSSGGQGSRGRR